MVKASSDVIIMDNGSYTVRVGTSCDEQPRQIPNCLFKSKSDRKRIFVGNEIDECVDRGSLFFVYACERGYLVNWDVEQQVWDRCLSPYLSNAPSSKLILSDLNYLVPAIKDQSFEILFENYEFGHLFKSSAPFFSAWASDQVALIIDVGFSCITVSAFLDAQPIQEAVILIELGGKVLTNQLKEWISYRHVNVMEETYVVNECKEDACFVSLDFDKDIDTARQRGDGNTVLREYVLPDFFERPRGFVRLPGTSDEAQTINVNHERFTLPEALFRPSNIGIDQMGVAEAAAEVIYRCPQNIRGALARNIVVTGGSSKFPNFLERLKRELSSYLDQEWEVSLVPVHDPSTHAWHGAKKAYLEDAFYGRFISRAEWAEQGDAIFKRLLDFAM